MVCPIVVAFTEATLKIAPVLGLDVRLRGSQLIDGRWRVTEHVAQTWKLSNSAREKKQKEIQEDERREKEDDERREEKRMRGRESGEPAN